MDNKIHFSQEIQDYPARVAATVPVLEELRETRMTQLQETSKKSTTLLESHFSSNLTYLFGIKELKAMMKAS